jgi:glutamate-1-semialdehyde 2,1-aminomutase
MGLVPPQPGYLQGLRELTWRFGALLIFDEVMTGWRVHPQGAQIHYGVTPDLTTLGKVVGGGLPAAAYGGRATLMQLVAPAGPVYQAGTLSGNPLAMAAGLATLRELRQPGLWQAAERWAIQATDLFTEAANAAGIALTVQRAGTMFTPFFTASPVRNYAEARTADLTAYRRFFHAMLDAGVYLPPSQFEASFSSTAHGAAELARLQSALASSLRVV